MSSTLRLLLLLMVLACAGAVFLWIGSEGDPAQGVEASPGVPLALPGADVGTALPGVANPPGPDAGRERLQPLAPEAPPIDEGPPTANGEDTGAEPGSRVRVRGRLVSPEGRAVADARVSLATGPASRLATLVARAAAGSEGDELPPVAEARSDADGAFTIEASVPPKPDDSDAPPVFLGGLMGSGPLLQVEHPLFVTLSMELGGLDGSGSGTGADRATGSGSGTGTGARTATGAATGSGTGNRAETTRELDLGELVLEPGGGLTGRVLGADRRPLPGARLAARPTDDEPLGLADILALSSGSTDQPPAAARSDGQGRFTLSGLRTGQVDLFLAAGEHVPLVRRGLDVEAGRLTDLGDLLLARGEVIGGVVLDGQGAPAARVPVRCSSEQGMGLSSLADLPALLAVGGQQRRTHSGDDGRFRFDGLESGSYRVAAGGEGWSRASSKGVMAGERGLRLVVEPLGELLVSVRSTGDGTPVAGLHVVAHAVEGERELPVIEGDELLRLAREERAGPSDGAREPLSLDLAGAALVREVGPDGARLTLTAPGFGGRELTVPGVHGGERATFATRLVPESTLAGRVVDELGQPLAGAEVQASWESDAQQQTGQVEPTDVRAELPDARTDSPHAGAEPPDARAVCDAQGRFRLEGLVAGTWELSAEASDMLPGEPLSVSLGEAESRTGVELVLQPGGTLVGAVIDSDGLPVAGARVSVTREEVPLLASDSDALQDRMGRQLEQAFGSGGSESRRLVSDSLGAFSASGLKPGSYSVRLLREDDSTLGIDLGSLLGVPDDDPERTRHVRVEPRAETRVVFVQGARASLVVRVIAAGRAAPEAQVSLAVANRSFLGIDLSGGGRRASTDAHGEARYDELEPGPYSVSAVLAGSPEAERTPLDLAPGEEGLIVLSFGSLSVEGRLTDASSGAPLAGVPVWAERETRPKPSSGGLFGSLFGDGDTSVSIEIEMNGSKVSGRSDGASQGTSGGDGPAPVRSEADGSFSLRFLHPGTWVVHAGGERWLERAGEPLSLAEGDPPGHVVLALERGGTIHGQVVQGSSELPLDGVDLELRPANPDEDDWIVRSDHGRYRFEGVAPGDYELAVLGDEGDRVLRKLHLSPGGQDLDVLLVTLD